MVDPIQNQGFQRGIDDPPVRLHWRSHATAMAIPSQPSIIRGQLAECSSDGWLVDVDWLVGFQCLMRDTRCTDISVTRAKRQGRAVKQIVQGASWGELGCVIPTAGGKCCRQNLKTKKHTICPIKVQGLASGNFTSKSQLYGKLLENW